MITNEHLLCILNDFGFSLTSAIFKMADLKQIRLRFDDKSEHGHSLFIKQHVVRKKGPLDNSSTNNTLLVLNIPPYVSEKRLRQIFGPFGKVTDLRIQKNPGNVEEAVKGTKYFPSPSVKGFYVAYLTFQTNKGLQKSLERANDESPIILSTEKCEMLTGVQKWCFEYVQSRPDVKKLQSEIDSFMEEYDKRVEEEEKVEVEKEGIPDDDGWVKVTKTGKNAGFSRSETNQLKIKQKEKKKRKERELLNVYTYQIRESKREKIADLRRKFEEDKQKIRAMKESRRFKPF